MRMMRPYYLRNSYFRITHGLNEIRNLTGSVLTLNDAHANYVRYYNNTNCEAFNCCSMCTVLITKRHLYRCMTIAFYVHRRSKNIFNISISLII